jgi:hypothetical protein
VIEDLLAVHVRAHAHSYRRYGSPGVKGSGVGRRVVIG